MSPIDWATWHDAYDDPDNPLARRLKAVQAHIHAAPPGPLRVVSVCAGQGTDLLLCWPITHEPATRAAASSSSTRATRRRRARRRRTAWRS